MTQERDLFFGTSGPKNADIAIVGESWGSEEEQAQRPFVGQSGKELDRMLQEAGINSAVCFKTNVISAKPSGNETERFFESNIKGAPKWRGLHCGPFVQNEVTRLQSQLRQVNPKVVIAAGNYALWALTDKLVSVSSISRGNGVTVLVPGGITSWRGSMLSSESSFKLLPIIHPAAILRAWYLRAVTVHDLKTRVKQALSDDWLDKATPQLDAPPTFDRAVLMLKTWLREAQEGPIRVACDIETKNLLITCIGFGRGPYDRLGYGLTIPFVRLLPERKLDSYWPPDQEVILVSLIQRILSHPRILIEGQNFLYDTQYIKEWLLVQPTCDFDTMLAHHLLFPGTPKGLDYLSSLYCRYHRYWKDDNKEWDLNADETTHLRYNCEDLLRTYECATQLRKLIVDLGQQEQWEWEKRKANLALRMMNRGIRIDTKRRSQYGFELSAALSDTQARLTSIIPKQLTESLVKSSKKPWYSSPKQQQTLFYERLGLPSQRNRKTGSVTVDDEALETLKAKMPELSPIFDLILTARSIGVFHNTFVSAELEPDNRMKCSFNPAGTETFRWSSSTNAFYRGTNLQNIPKGDEE
jgi:uracil-DNA glycosylase family 4